MAVNPIYERGMFSGPPQVTPQPSLGTGITSGLLDEPMPAAPRAGPRHARRYRFASRSREHGWVVC
jgi:hypothetical protein